MKTSGIILIPYQQYKGKYKLKILAYCIMSNHVPQKVGRPKKKDK